MLNQSTLSLEHYKLFEVRDEEDSWPVLQTKAALMKMLTFQMWRKKWFCSDSKPMVSFEGVFFQIIIHLTHNIVNI